jgi:hypothetical protein
MSLSVESASGLEEEYELRNHSDLEDHQLRADPQMRGLLRELSRWTDGLRASQQRGNMFDRTAYTPPANVYDEMKAARTAMDFDDIVSGVADITESFAFQGMKFESTDADGADVFNQWSAEVNMDGVMRRMWREEYALSQLTVASRWGWRTYKVRGRVTSDQQEKEHDAEQLQQITDQQMGVPTLPDKPKKPKGRKRRKEYRLWVPTQINILDSTKIVPVDHSPLNPEKLAWHASKAEIGLWNRVSNGEIVDLDMSNFFVGHYKPGRDEAARLARMGIDPDSLLLMNPEFTFRHTLTKADYEAYPQLRMKSLFPLLDLKRQLVNADRAALIGAANYILLVKKGTDDKPGTQEEVEHLKNNYNFIAKLPVIISDHRLNIEIITPKIDLTLQGDKYDTLDTRILMRLLGTLSIGARGQRNETNITLSNSVARMMENRRHMMKRTIEKYFVKAVCEHPKNTKANGDQQIEDEPNLVFLPRHVTLGFDQALVQALLSLRTQREISRETILEEFGLDQATEALRMEHEEEVYDEIFKTQIPFAAPGAGGAPGGQNLGDPGANGRQGGRPAGGGAPTQDKTKAKPKSPGGNTSTKSDLEDDEL